EIGPQQPRTGAGQVDSFRFEHGGRFQWPNRVTGDAGKAAFYPDQALADFAGLQVNRRLRWGLWWKAVLHGQAVSEGFRALSEDRHAGFEPRPRFVRNFAGQQRFDPFRFQFAADDFQGRKTFELPVTSAAIQQPRLAFGKLGGHVASERSAVRGGKRLQSFALSRRKRKLRRLGIRERFSRQAALVPFRRGQLRE